MDNQETRKTTRRPVVGIMTGSFHTDYSRVIAAELSSRLRKENIDVCLFQGLDASRFLKTQSYVDEGFDGHYYSLFQYSKFFIPDILVISFGTISAIHDPVTLRQFVAALPKVPIILLEDETRLENGTFITVDNYVGMSSCVEHLISEHGYRDIMFVTGPDDVHDAELRKQAYLDVMKAHGLEVTEDMICHGNFTDHIEDEVEELLRAHPKPEAIVCANDEMAECVYRVLRSHGLAPGKDVAVTGFDDNVSAQFLDPPLTSVRQNCPLVADSALTMIKSILNGQMPEPVFLPAELTIRESCGCVKKAENDNVSRHTKVLADRSKIKRLTHETMLTSLMLRNLLTENITVHVFFENLGKMLKSLNIQESVIALLPEPMDITDKPKLFLPEELKLHLSQDGENITTYSRKDAPTISAFRLNPCFDFIKNCKKIKAVFPLFYRNNHYGFFVTTVDQEDLLLHYALSLEIGTGLRYLYMALDQQEAKAALEEKNHILNFSASHDELTGLYNRAGVMKEIYSFVRGSGTKGTFVAVMADLDHLKQINDTFGHSSGDLAIKKAAEILRDALPMGSPLGRSGGDEFSAVFLLTNENDKDEFVKRVKAGCNAYNAISNVPFYEEISVGCAVFGAENAADIPTQLKKADYDLYEQKKKRRESVIR